MKHVLFVCQADTCCSSIAEFIMRDLVKKAGLEGQLHIESAATGPDEDGRMACVPSRFLPAEHSVNDSGKPARRMRRDDYNAFDLLIGMEWANISYMDKICGGDPEGKFRLLLDYTGRPGEIRPPSPVNQFESVWSSIQAGCQGLLKTLTASGGQPGKSRRVLCYGDSNTYGYDPRSLLGERYPEFVRWTALLRRRGWQSVNEGLNGRAIPHLTGEIESACRTLLPQRADAIVVMLGTNDLLRHPRRAAEHCAKRMEYFLTCLLTKSPSCKLLLAAPPAILPGAWVSDKKTLEESCRLPLYYEEAARRLGVGFANAAEWQINLTFDGVHFSKNGHRTFAAEMHKALCGLFDE